jgi:translation initiation factor 1A
MPKKAKRKKKPISQKQRSIEFAETDAQQYAKIVNILGDRRVTVMLADNTERLALIPGRFRKRVWMTRGDIVLISLREFQDDKVDIIHKYFLDEARSLCSYGEIPISFLDSEGARAGDEDIQFGSDSDDEADIDIDGI